MRKKQRISAPGMGRVLICMGLALLLAGIPVLTGFNHAEGRVKPEMVLPDHYPNGFDGYGHINRIERDEVVIDDMYFRLSPTIQYHTPGGMNASPAFFKPGAFVGFLANAEEEILSLWLLE